MNDFINMLQWPAMTVTLYSAWLVASQSKKRREHGFLWFLLSNILWVIWGLHDEAYALVALQVGLASLNIRGVLKNNATTQST